MKKLKIIKSAWYYFGTRNYYQGIDKPTLWQWIHTWRVGLKTAWKLACIIHN